MDAISPTQSAQFGSQNSQTFSSTQNSTSVDYDAFLSLLVTQLKNQDPTEPTDNAQLMAQLASFSSVEQQVQINDKLETLISSNILGDASSLIGKTITSVDGSITGVVSSIIIASDGIVAELEDGTRVGILPGTIISETPTSSGAQADE
jgi:flagellar basal-body rod modification protein FlgD